MILRLLNLEGLVDVGIPLTLYFKNQRQQPFCIILDIELDTSPIDHQARFSCVGTMFFALP
jgi:hypothetical protein